MSNYDIDLRKDDGKESTMQLTKPKEAEAVVTNINGAGKSNYVEWKVGDRCEAFYKEDNKYYPAIINKIDDFQIDVTVIYIGFGNSAVVDMSLIRKPTTKWDVGTKCRVIFHGDGNFYDAIIESITPEQVNIKYTKFGTYDSVRKTDLKIAVKAIDQSPTDELRVLPTDDKKTVNMKKKKLFLLQKEKEAKEENDYFKGKQSSWKQYQNRSQQKRKHLVAEGVIADPFKKDSIFRTSEGATRTSGAAPIEMSMTPAPKRSNLQHK